MSRTTRPDRNKGDATQYADFMAALLAGQMATQPLRLIETRPGGKLKLEVDD